MPSCLAPTDMQLARSLRLCIKAAWPIYEPQTDTRNIGHKFTDRSFTVRRNAGPGPVMTCFFRNFQHQLRFNLQRKIAGCPTRFCLRSHRRSVLGGSRLPGLMADVLGSDSDGGDAVRAAAFPSRPAPAPQQWHSAHDITEGSLEAVGDSTFHQTQCP